MGEVGDGSMSSLQFEHLHTTENNDGSMSVDISQLENPDVTLYAAVKSVARYCSRENKELRVKVRLENFRFIALLIQMGFDKIYISEPTYIVLREDQSDTILGAKDLHKVEEASFDSSVPQARFLALPQVPSWGKGSLDPSKKLHWNSFGITLLDTITEQVPFQTIDQDLPHSIPGPRAVGIPEIKQRVKHPVVADLPSSAGYLEDKGDKPDSESEAMDVPTDEEALSDDSEASVESHTEIASSDSPRSETSRKRSAASAFDEDNLFAQIRPYVNQQIEEALLPLMSVLRSQEEDEHKHRQKMLALEQEKLALMRQKLECTRRSNAVPASVAK